MVGAVMSGGAKHSGEKISEHHYEAVPIPCFMKGSKDINSQSVKGSSNLNWVEFFSEILMGPFPCHARATGVAQIPYILDHRSPVEELGYSRHGLFVTQVAGKQAAMETIEDVINQCFRKDQLCRELQAGPQFRFRQAIQQPTTNGMLGCFLLDSLGCLCGIRELIVLQEENQGRQIWICTL